MLNTNGFVISGSCNMNVNVENRADILEETFGISATIDKDKTANTNFQKDILDQ